MNIENKTIFIDLDGTLVDIAPRHYRVYTESLAMFKGTAPIPFEQYWWQKRCDTPWNNILQQSSLSPEREREFLEEFRNRIEKSGELFQDKLLPGAFGALERLFDKNALYLLSLRRDKEALAQQIDHLGVRHFFRDILSGHSNTKSGTLRKKADIICSQKVDPQNVVIIGDTEADVAAAKSIGAMSIAVTSGIRDYDFLEKLSPDVIIRSVGDIL